MGRYNRYRRRRNYRRKRGRTTRVNIASRTGAKAQSQQIMSLSRQVKTLRRKTTALRQWGQYKFDLNRTGGAELNLLSGAMTIIPLVQPDEWAPIFQASNDQQNSDKITLTGFNLRTMFILGDTNVPSPPMYADVFLVTLKKQTANQLQDYFVQELNQNTSQPYEYTAVAAAGSGSDGLNEFWARVSIEEGLTSNQTGMIMLNKSAFNTHYHKRFFLGNQTNWQVEPVADQDRPVTNLKDTTKFFQMPMKFNRTIKTYHGKWSDLDQGAVDPMDQVYLMIHYDKPTVAEIGMNLAGHVVFTGYTAN